MAPGKKQANRNQKEKVDDEPAVTSTSSQAAILAAGKELVRGSVLAEVGQKLPKLMKKGSTESLQVKAEGGDDREESAETDTTTASSEPVAEDASLLLEGLTQRLSVKNPLGIDKAPDETWELFTSQDLDFGPHKRKKGNPAMERIMVNFERNMAPYLHILLGLMCVRALLLRSWFACLPWLVGYQFLSMYVPINSIRESFPKVQEKMPPVEDKHRVTATMCFHALVWLFFLYECAYATYIFEKILLMLCFVGHAYMVAPVLDPEASRKAITEKNKQEAAPTVAATSNAKENWEKIQAQVKGSVLLKRSRALPELVKDIAASRKKNGKSEEKKEDSSEKTGDDNDEKTADADNKTNGEGNSFNEVKRELSAYNMLGLAKSPEEAEISWKTFKSHAVNLARPAKGKGATKQRIMTNLEQHTFQYVNILLALMCLRAFLFRSWFACLPVVVLCQLLSLKLPLPTVDSKVRVVVSLGFHILLWFFFVYETAFRTHFLEKCLMTGMFIGHAYLVSPVVN